MRKKTQGKARLYRGIGKTVKSCSSSGKGSQDKYCQSSCKAFPQGFPQFLWIDGLFWQNVQSRALLIDAVLLMYL